MTASQQPEEVSRTVTVKVWEGSQFDSADELVNQENPDEYELPVVDLEYGVLDALSDDARVILADDIDHHGTYAFLVESDSNDVVLNVHTNDSYHDPTDWDNPIERGLTYRSDEDDIPPFKCELWGRIMMWVEPTDPY
ncbi:hypothetical protein [Salinibaculum rarum]|uniref:hypothetical protein n=1 Tax=Salinibaculum rarum TaxID=3058903 RepID=UPI00266014F5|nr:hypothetical protein [Salinibaculum sp. KK48]